MMYKKIFLLLIFLGMVTVQAKAAEPFSQIVRNDGIIINKCVDSFGKIDYCTAYDRNNAEELIKNPKKYFIKEEILLNNNASINPNNQVIGQTYTNQKTNTRTFGENCMDVQYAVGTGSTLVNSIINTINNFKR